MRSSRGVILGAAACALVLLLVALIGIQSADEVSLMQDHENMLADALAHQAEGQQLASLQLLPTHHEKREEHSHHQSLQLLPTHKHGERKHSRVNAAVKAVKQQLNDDMGDDTMGLLLGQLSRKLGKLEDDMIKQKRELKGANPRVITVNVRPRGHPGRTGPVGQSGRTGEIGPVGPAGNRGPRGPQGPRGVQGDRGAQGPVGRTGADGPEGNPGPVGLPGPQGERGDTGLIGMRGPSGAPGAPGRNGLNGARGPPGFAQGQGPPGPMGSIGVRGGPGAPGKQGPQGNPGDAGPPGAIGQPGMAGAPGLPGPIGAPATFSPYNTVNIGSLQDGRIRGGYARARDINWPTGAWSLAMWVYVGKSAPAGATPFSYEANGTPRIVTLTDQCSKIWLDNNKLDTGMTCAPGEWTHVIVAYNGRQISTFKNALPTLTFDRTINVPSGGQIVLGQDYNNAQMNPDNALAPGQVGAPQLYNTAVTSSTALAVKTGTTPGTVLANLTPYKVHGIVNFDANTL